MKMFRIGREVARPILIIQGQGWVRANGEERQPDARAVHDTEGG